MNLQCVQKFLTPQGTKILAYEIIWIYSTTVVTTGRGAARQWYLYKEIQVNASLA